MKLPPFSDAGSTGGIDAAEIRDGRRAPSAFKAGFTMVEIAISLAVIGFALVAIIGVLPIGMSVQKENREETVINFDAAYLMDAIRSGSQGLDNLTNYVLAITNISSRYDATGKLIKTYPARWYTATNYCADGINTKQLPALTNGLIIMGLLNQPKYIYDNTSGFPPGTYWSNYVTADIRAITGSPTDQGTSAASKDFAFRYRVSVEVLPAAAFPLTWADPDKGTENFSAPGLTTQSNTTDKNQHAIELSEWQLAKNRQVNLTDIRLRFRWPVIGGKLGNGNQVYRTSASGQFAPTDLAKLTGGVFPPPPFPLSYYLIQGQSYAAAP